MIRVLFVCHGNICRSPMAEFIMKDLAQKAGLSSQFEIASAATSTEEIGNPVYPPAQRKLGEHGIGCSGKTARQMPAGGLQPLGSAHRDGSGKPAPDAADLRRRPRRQNPPAHGLYQPSGRGCGPLVLRGFRYSLDRYSRGLRGAAPHTDS